MRFKTFIKGDIAVLKTMTDLQEKGYRILLPFSEQSPYDLVVHDEINNKFYRIQVKMLAGKKKELKNSSWDGFHGKAVKYDVDSFDYYAAYIPEKEIIIYPSFNFGGKTIRISMPNSPTPFYWFEDFLNFTDTAQKKTLKDFGLKFIPNRNPDNCKHRPFKSLNLTKEQLEKLVWEKTTVDVGKQFGVSDKSISNWCRRLGIQKPARGYWEKVRHGKVL